MKSGVRVWNEVGVECRGKFLERFGERDVYESINEDVTDETNEKDGSGRSAA